MLESKLVWINLALLNLSDAFEVNSSLPSWLFGKEHVLDLFKSLACRLGEEKERMDCHGDREDSKDEVGFPLDIDKGRRREITKSEVKNPVGGGCNGDSFAADAEREELGRVDPTVTLSARESLHGRIW